MSDQPARNERAPLNEGSQLSPPIVRKPIYECAKAVHVESFIPHALVTVFADGIHIVGQEKSYIGQADITLKRPLKAGEKITATQEVFGLVSAQSYKPVVTLPELTSLGKPAVGSVIYACGRVVPVSGLTPSTHVEVYASPTQPVPIDTAHLIGTGENTGTSMPVVTQALKVDWFVAARQICCVGTDHELDSKPSAAIKVSAEPHPLLPPVLDVPITGNDVANLHNLYVGADIAIKDETAHSNVGGGLATGDANWAPVHPNFIQADLYDATQSLCTHSKPSPPVHPTSHVPDLVLHSPICVGDNSVIISGSVINAVVVLYKTGISAPIGFGGAVNGELTLSIGPIGLPLKIGEEVSARQYIGASLISLPSNKVIVGDCRNVVTQHNDMRRTGAYLHEKVLTPSSVSPATFGRLFERNVNGSPFAQILYVRNVANTHAGTKNLFFVATSTNDIYAFDADDKSSNPDTPPIWKAHLGFARLLNAWEICRETIGAVGVTSTPVIDVTTQTMYVVGERWRSDTPTPVGTANMDGSHFLHALRLSDGSDKVPAIEIGGKDPRTGITFDPKVQRNRPGLLLLNGVIYVGFATFSCDGGDYHGWVFGYSTSDLSPRGIFCTSQHGDTGSGIWQSGNGLVGSDDGFIYFETGNDKGARGDLNPTYGDSFIRLRVTDKAPFLEQAGQFQPSNFRRLQDGDYTTDPAKADDIHFRKDPNPGATTFTQIDDKKFANGTPTPDHWGDTDLGSGGPILLPGGLLVGGGKQGRYYVIESESMKLTQDTASPDKKRIGPGFQAFQNTYRDVAGDKSQHYLVYGATEVYGPNIHGGPCFWEGQGLLYQMAEKDFLKAFSYDVLSGTLNETPAHTATVRPPYGMPGGHSSISADGDQHGVVWTLFPQGDGQWDPQQGTLVAFDALSLNKLWEDAGSDSATDPASSEWFAKFNPPTIADGKVFRPCFAQYKVPVDTTGKDTGGVPTVLKPGKVVVYGLTSTGKMMKQIIPLDGLTAIRHVWERQGGSGMLSEMAGETVSLGDSRKGFRQDFVGYLQAGRRRSSTKLAPEHATCHRPSRSTIPVTSSLFWSPETGAHLVTGEIRTKYLELGGPAGKLGYPINDEADAESSGVRVSHFEHGAITWTAEKGAVLVSKR